LPTTLQLAKVATPLVAATVLLVQVRVAPLPGWEAMAKVTEAFEVATVFPLESSMVTRGWGARLAPLAAPPGWVVKTS